MVAAEEALRGCLYAHGATPAAIDMMECQLGIRIPESYRRFLSRSNGCDGPIGDLWIILYPAEAVVAETARYRLSTGVEDAVFIGTDGGGEALCPRHSRRPAVFWVDALHRKRTSRRLAARP